MAAYILASVGIVYLLDTVYDNVVVPIGMKIGDGVDAIKEIPENIKQKKIIHDLTIKKQQRDILIKDIKKRQSLRKLDPSLID